MRTRRGFALFAAVWLLVGLGAVSLELSIRSSSERMEALRLSDGARARAAARSGLEITQADLQRRLDGIIDASSWGAGARISVLDPWAFVAGSPADTITIEGTVCRITREDAGARLNLNQVGDSQLRRLLIALRIDAGRADHLVDAIMDWRDADDFRRANGAERDDYLAAGAPVLPRNGPFADVDELRRVMGVDDAIFKLLRPYLTVVGTGIINVNSAESPILSTLPGMTDEAVAVILERRRAGRPIANLDELANALSSPARTILLANMSALLPRVVFSTREILVRADAGPAGGASLAHLEALVVRGGNNAYVVWRRIS